MKRPSNRANHQMRSLEFTRNFINHADGSTLISLGNTKIICTVSIENGVPRFIKGKNMGWLTAEYAMLPRSTHERMAREAVRGKQSGRTLEISRLISRSLRSALDLTKLGEITLHVDCDVIQADGGTRCAAITGSMIALIDAIAVLKKRGIKANPLRFMVAATSVGVYQNEIIVDLDYAEDSSADTDLNLIMNDQHQIIEIQATAEKNPFNKDELNQMLDIGSAGLTEVFSIMQQALN